MAAPLAECRRKYCGLKFREHFPRDLTLVVPRDELEASLLYSALMSDQTLMSDQHRTQQRYGIPVDVTIFD